MVFGLKICKKIPKKKSLNPSDKLDLKKKSFHLFNSYKVPNLNKTTIVKTPPRPRLNLSRWVVP
jgi:hypothetical protein